MSTECAPEACSATEAPVRAYCAVMADFHQQPWHVVTIPEETEAWSLGYRFAAVDDADRQHYLNWGAREVCTVTVNGVRDQEILAALAALDLPKRYARPNGPAYPLGGVHVLPTNLADALTWALNIVRAGRRRDDKERGYCTGWVASHHLELDAIHAKLTARLQSVSLCGSSDELERFDSALCDAIERLNTTRSLGRVSTVDGRLSYRPPPFVAAVATQTVEVAEAPAAESGRVVEAPAAVAEAPARDVRTEPRVGDVIRFPLTGTDHLLGTRQSRMVEGFWGRWGQRGVLVGSAAGRPDLEAEHGVERWTMQQWSEREDATYTAVLAPVEDYESRYHSLLGHFHALQDKYVTLLMAADVVLDAWVPGPRDGEIRHRRGVGMFALVNAEGWWAHDRGGQVLGTGHETGDVGKHLADKCLDAASFSLIGGVHPAPSGVAAALGKLVSMIKCHDWDGGGFTNRELQTIDNAIVAIGGVP